ncbi:hypothetical protein RB4807 [Rhodopirellula baltica SH 1]|uniref:Uncharacterized protein n=1 Tax=Rhodopirellula baltica (strain DSM 10527 / NCIMB 13988 / SH1) TaxID=243090 RepID=Q7UH69_RHOBA|nr:hypothetical protein RB4807 [Rhodopirellula baltica SH 1]
MSCVGIVAEAKRLAGSHPIGRIKEQRDAAPAIRPATCGNSASLGPAYNFSRAPALTGDHEKGIANKRSMVSTMPPSFFLWL